MKMHTSTSTNRSRIIVVDDDAVTRELLHENLAAHYDVRVVASAEAAIEQLQLMHADVVIADWLMPESTGLDLLRWVRAQPLRHQPHFVMLTANTAAERLVEAFNAGVDDFLCKPFDGVELRARMQAWTRLVSLQNQALSLTDQLRHANEKLTLLALCDDLTGLCNRRAAVERLTNLVRLAERHDHPLTCALLDLDHFKQFNDCHGHAVGDEVLRHFADLLEHSTRNTDICCRLSGDEFLVILPHTSLDASATWATHFTTLLSESPLRRDTFILGITASIGLAAWRKPLTPPELIDEADQMLYSAKHAGRDVIRAQRA